MVESLPVAEPIKLGEGDLEPLFDNYRQSLRNLAACGVTIVCYNFMPVLDWTRTELHAVQPGGGRALRFNAHEFAAFDCFMLERPGAEADHPPEVVARGARLVRRARPRATGGSCSPTSWPACPAPSTATTSPACAGCWSATAA